MVEWGGVMGKTRVTVPGGTLPPPTQQHLHVADVIPPGIIVCRDGTLAMVLEVQPVDLSLSSAEDQGRWAAMYEGFLASWTEGVIQVVVASFPHDCREFRQRWEEAIARMEEEEALGVAPPGRADLARGYLDALDAVLRSLQPMDFRYFVAVSVNPFPLRGEREVVISSEAMEKGKQRVIAQAERARALLEAHQFRARVLSEEEVEEVFRAFYHLPAPTLRR